MKLTNYMWLLIWLFLGGFFLVKLPQKEEYVCQKKVNLWSKFSAIALAAPYAIWAGFRGYVGDTWLYRNGFLDASKNILDIPVFFVNGTKDPGYEAFVIIMKNIVGNNPEIFFLIVTFSASNRLIRQRPFMLNISTATISAQSSPSTANDV